jgi:hypothetical protein
MFESAIAWVSEQIDISAVVTDIEKSNPQYGPAWLTTQDLPKQALICGSAPCLFEDFANASKQMPGACIVVVNEAGNAIRGSHLVTQHPEKASWFRERSLNPAIVIHTGKPEDRARQPDIDVYWPGSSILATSGGSAIAIALQMGFRNIVLCGMPMQGGDGYFKGSALMQDEPRFGLEDPDCDYIRQYRSRLVEWASAEPEVSKRVRSCSGFTRELFGPPDWEDGVNGGRRR